MPLQSRMWEISVTKAVILHLLLLLLLLLHGPVGSLLRSGWVSVQKQTEKEILKASFHHQTEMDI